MPRYVPHHAKGQEGAGSRPVDDGDARGRLRSLEQEAEDGTHQGVEGLVRSRRRIGARRQHGELDAREQLDLGGERTQVRGGSRAVQRTRRGQSQNFRISATRI